MALEKRGIGGLTLRIAFGQLIVILVALVNVGATAWLMFLSPHDFTLLGSLLAFAAAMALFMSLALARSIAAAVGGVTAAARRMAAGDLSARAPRVSQDELGELASAFNLMADALEMAAERQQSAENARREVVAAISHDLRTPLASIRAMVEAINDGVVADAETIQRYLRTTQNETERLGQLIDDLFELSQLDAGALQPQLEMGSLHDLISDTLGSLEIQAEKHGVRLVASVDPGIGPARFDSRRIQRVLDNLVGNAIRHTPAGGQVELSAAAVNGDIKVTVRDTGEGIAPEEQDRIFERFYRGEKSRARDGAGAGLGLTIARGIVHAHGGRIWLESKPGQGTAFFFTLPRMNSIERE
jgi:signal transduction histidine kinase